MFAEGNSSSVIVTVCVLVPKSAVPDDTAIFKITVSSSLSASLLISSEIFCVPLELNANDEVFRV